MESTVRVARRGFISRITRGGERTHLTVFRAPHETTVGPKPARYIKVVFDLIWHDESDSRHDRPIDIAEGAVGGSLYRVKCLLEQSLLQEIDVDEIVIGCIKVKYIIPEPTTRELVQKAVDRLWANREFYSVTDVFGHLDGRAVTAI